MTAQTAQRLATLAAHLGEAVMAAALCAQEIQSEIRTELAVANGGPPAGPRHPASADATPRPLVDASTLSVTWRGRSVHLGHNRGFRLLDRLARRPNQYVTHLDLLRDVWDDEELSTDTIRSVASQLRGKLRAHGMCDLADAIRGHGGRYALVL